MLDERFIFLGLALSLYGASRYIISTIRGQTKPNRVTWLLWAILPFIALAAELDEGVGLVALLTFIVGFNPLMVFVASFVNKKAYWKLGRSDYIFGLLALLGLALWQLTGDGNLAIGFALLADFLAGIPTLMKAWKFPETENHEIFLYGAINAGITLLVIDTWDFAHWAFPVYIFLYTVALTLIIRFKFGNKLLADS